MCGNLFPTMCGSIEFEKIFSLNVSNKYVPVKRARELGSLGLKEILSYYLKFL